MGVCVSWSDAEPGPCLGWDTPVGVAVNLAFWIGLTVFVVLFIRVVRSIRRERPIDIDDFRRIMLKGVNPWLFFGSWGTLAAGWILAHVAR